MKRFRIQTNGKKYRVQYRVKLGIFDFWRTETYLEVSDTYPKVIKHPVEFESFEKAEEYVLVELEKPEAQESPKKGWKTVCKYSDKSLARTGGS